MWDKDQLQDLMRNKLGGQKFFIVSNRQPVKHVQTKGRIETARGIGGVVTALEPVVKACGGTWVGLSDGNADRAVSDSRGRFIVKDLNGSYTLKRVWLNRQDMEGYYYGYANGAIWPLCHMTFKRPEFRRDDWERYKLANEKFAEAILEEAEGQKSFVWIQDYHFALVSKILKERAPKQFLTAQFWHIPWPSSEAFRICPQRKEILNGLLSNDLIGFHIKYHCNNFFDVVDKELVCRVDREHDAVITNESETLVRSYPISIDYEQASRRCQSYDITRHQAALNEEFDLKDKLVIVGIDRIDYTKGIPERLLAFDLLLKQRPELKGKVSFVQIGALSRIHIDVYKDLNEEINKIVENINWRHGDESWRPIVFVRRNLSVDEICALYRMADVGVVSSLHDGMNLVAKEYVAGCDPTRGMLVLSRFTGASRELTDAVLINPFDREECASAMAQALDMPAEEKAKRNQRMREIIETNNIYRWAGKTLSDLFKFNFTE